MIAATPPDDVDLVVTVSPVLVAVVGATLLLWITVLTVFVLLRCREPWRDDGRPVFKRLPNGRIRFSWGWPRSWLRCSASPRTQSRHTLARPLMTGGRHDDQDR